MLSAVNSGKYNFKEIKEFDLSLIRFDIAVRKMCEQNICGKYGNNHMCPPGVKGMEQWKEDILLFEKGMVVTKVYPLKRKYDMNAMLEGIKDFQKTLLTCREDVHSRFPEMKTLFLGAGSGVICRECTYADEAPCRFPEKAFPSIEACGIDVMSLSKSVGVKYNNGKNTVTYLGVILYSRKKTL